MFGRNELLLESGCFSYRRDSSALDEGNVPCSWINGASDSSTGAYLQGKAILHRTKDKEHVGSMVSVRCISALS